MGERNGEQVRTMGCACSELHHSVQRGGFQAVPDLAYILVYSVEASAWFCSGYIMGYGMASAWFCSGLSWFTKQRFAVSYSMLSAGAKTEGLRLVYLSKQLPSARTPGATN